MTDKGTPLPKFGEWDVNDPASAEGFTVIFNKARDEKKTGGKPDSPGNTQSKNVKSGIDHTKSQPVSSLKISFRNMLLFHLFITFSECCFVGFLVVTHLWSVIHPGADLGGVP